MTDSKELAYIKDLYQADIIQQQEFDKAEQYLHLSNTVFINYQDAIDWLIQNRAVSRDRQDQVKTDFAAFDLTRPIANNIIEIPAHLNKSEPTSNITAPPADNQTYPSLIDDQQSINYNNNIMLLDDLVIELLINNQQYQIICEQLKRNPHLTFNDQQQLIDWLMHNNLLIKKEKTKINSNGNIALNTANNNRPAIKIHPPQKKNRAVISILIIIYCLYRFGPTLWQEWQEWQIFSGTTDNATLNKYEAAVFNGIQDVDYLIAKKQPQSPKLIDMIDSVKLTAPCSKTTDDVIHCQFTVHYNNNQRDGAISGSYPLAVKLVYKNDVLVVKSLNDFMKVLIDGMYQDQKKPQSQG